MDEEIWVIVVDDDISNLKIAGTILSDNDMRVTALNSGTSLLEYIKAGNTPDIILLDILMPKLDGFGTLWRLRKELRCDIPVIFLTADENPESVEKGKKLGAADFIRKPFEPDTLVESVLNILDIGGGVPEPEDEKITEQNVSTRETLEGGIEEASEMFSEPESSRGALMLERESFGAIYRYLMRHMERYNGSAYKVMFRISPRDNEMTETELSDAAARFGEVVRGTLRNSDIILRYRTDEYFMLLPMVSCNDITKVTQRIEQLWRKEPSSMKLRLTYETEPTGCVRHDMPEISGLDWRYARINLPNDKMLTDTVKDFYGSMKGRTDRLNKSYKAIDKDNEALTAYRIEVHAMKSSSAMVGLIQLSGLARTLEELAKAADTGGIHKLHDLFIKEWDKARGELGDHFGDAKSAQSEKSGTTVLPTLLGVLKSSIEEMDIDAVDRTLTKISSYKYDDHTKELVEKLRDAAMELDDSAYEIIKELLK